MTLEEIQLLADAIADALVKKLRPQATVFAKASTSTAETIARLAGEMGAREQVGAERKNEMVRAVADLRLELAGLSGRIDTVLKVLGHSEPEPTPEPEAEPPKPRTAAAADELQAEALTTGTRFLRWCSTRPEALSAAASAAAAQVAVGARWAMANPTKAVLIGLGVIGALRVLAPHIPYAGVIADVLQPLVTAIAPTSEAP